MSLYISEINKPRQGEYDTSFGLDIDDAVVGPAPPDSETGAERAYFDYDLLIKGVSSSGVVIPSDLDDGFRIAIIIFFKIQIVLCIRKRYKEMMEWLEDFN